MQDKQIVIDDTLISYSDLNPDSSRALVFLHGWQSNNRAWHDVIDRLKDNNVRIIALDFPGFGRSPLPKAAWGIGDYAGAIKKFLEKLELNDVILVGHSFGGRVAIKLAATSPNSVSKLVLVDAAGLEKKNLFTKMKILAAKTVKPLFSLPGIKYLKQGAYSMVGALDYADAGALREIFVKTINEDLSHHLPQIKAPTLLIWGEKDDQTPVAFGQIMNRLIPNSKLIVFPLAGHFSFIDQPEKFSELIQGQL